MGELFGGESGIWQSEISVWEIGNFFYKKGNLIRYRVITSYFTGNYSGGGGGGGKILC
ncbi:MAG: hypothetical protein FWG98_04740 [Candidatus Cloacimonetes bacterium]|nr:hypothetical protein [Candidatus Cloacimonadota bacterium]